MTNVCNRHHEQHQGHAKPGHNHNRHHRSGSHCRRSSSARHQHGVCYEPSPSRGHGHHHHHNHDEMHHSVDKRRNSMRLEMELNPRRSHSHRRSCQHQSPTKYPQRVPHRKPSYDCGSYSSDGNTSDECYCECPHDDRGRRMSDRRIHQRRTSRRDASCESVSSGSSITPMNYGTQKFKRSPTNGWQQGYPGEPMQQPAMNNPYQQMPIQQPYPQQYPPQQAPYPAQQLQQPQQQQQQKPPPPELEELRKNVFRGIKEFSKSLRKQQWYGDGDYLRSSRRVRNGHKPETLEDHRRKSRRRDWVVEY